MRGTAHERAWAILVLLAASTLATGDEDPVAPPDLILLWSDPQQCVPEAVKRDLIRETGALFASWGVRLRSSEGLASEGAHDVRVVLLDQAWRDERGTRVLGKTHARPRDFPAVWILVPNVREMLERTEWGASPGVLARALARVAAHEVLHVAAPGLGHASHGLMRAGLGARDLASHKVPVNSAFRRALLEAVSRRAGKPRWDAREWDLTASQSTPDRPAMAPGAGATQLGGEGTHEAPRPHLRKGGRDADRLPAPDRRRSRTRRRRPRELEPGRARR